MNGPQPFAGGLQLDAGTVDAVKKQMAMQDRQLALQERVAEVQVEREEAITKQVLTKEQAIRVDVLRAVAGHLNLDRPTATQHLQDITQWVLSGAVKKQAELPLQ